MADPALLARLATLGTEPFLAGPDEFATFQQAEIGRWARVVRDARITLD
jgi:tripartite-type tricarboxylate transporter receptor subunit TctC